MVVISSLLCNSVMKPGVQNIEAFDNRKRGAEVPLSGLSIVEENVSLQSGIGAPHKI